MKKGNVLFLGNSGVGKTTLINSIMGTDAETGIGIDGTTKEAKAYDNDDVPFRIIDTMGFEPTKWFQKNKAVQDIKKWSKNAANNQDEENEFDLICLCVDGTSSKLFSKTIDEFLKSISVWKTVPIIVVITKSYSIPDRELNIEMVKSAFEGKNRTPRGIYPVVASPYVINDSYAVAPEGISELIEGINELMPEGIKAAKNDIDNYVLTRKRQLAHGSVVVFTGAGVTVGAIPIPFSDALLLVPTETSEINLIAKIYSINNNDQYKVALKSIIDVGTVSLVAKQLISALKAIPGINVAASVINAIIAGVIVCGIGEASIYVFEQIYLGNKSIDDIDWIKNSIEKYLSNGSFISKLQTAISKLPENPSKSDILQMIIKLFGK